MLPENTFTLAYYESILIQAKASGYNFCTLAQYWHDPQPEKLFILRHDVDTNPLTLKGVLDVEEIQNVPSTVYVRVTSNNYNPFDYRTFPLFDRVSKLGGELGLHSNFVEFAKLNGINSDSGILNILIAEHTALSVFYPICGIACHRDLNYTYNSLPWIEKHWPEIQKTTGLVYQAYEQKIMDNLIYVNETAEQRLGWRKWTPEDAIATGRSICLSTHPHWWFKDHPFEV
jgi:hypothetical protein